MAATACHSSQSHRDHPNATDSLINTGGTAAPPGYQRGAVLITHNDCFTCHRIDTKLRGPSYLDISKKYGFNEGNVENLAHKIIYGGGGLWDTAVMTPHPNLVEEDAKAMAAYILSLNHQ
ncbi:cytochrome c class I [Russula earlei]|uniref:Cytochrome c class I n=1 Tax=Russula earlei TaxID=71964 RepID=A0ACC0TRQ1_9AGAM|nr:cytochrome c class I [Russula earlei]